jgi:glycosyltransferase involved in cell wall biosynthesis
MQILTTVIPVYNGEKFLAETLQSVGRQTRRPDRLIVLDNCSTDGSRRIVEQFNDMPCEWRQNEKNLGLFGNLNRALAFSNNTQYLHILHADDLIKPDFYSRMLSAMEAISGRALAYCQTEFIDENSAPTKLLTIKATTAKGIKTVAEFLTARSELQPILCPAVLLKTAGQPPPCQFRMDMPQIADLVFWAEWATFCEQIVELPDLLADYRLHTSNETRRNETQLQTWMLDEWKAMQMIESFRQGSGFSRWLHGQKLRLIFAARSYDKVKIMRGQQPEFARKIHVTASELIPLPHWLLGKAAIGFRDTLRHFRN